MLEMVIKYATQPSTWRGIVGIATAAGVAISPEMSAQIIAVGLALAGLVNVFRNEKKSE